MTWRPLTLNNIGTLILFSICIGSCRFQQKDKIVKTFPERDFSIDTVTAYNNRFMDSTEVDAFILKNKLDSQTAQNLRAFYNSRNYQFAWFDKNSLNEQGVSFWNLLNSYIHMSKDSSLFDQSLDKQMTDYIDEGVKHADREQVAETDLTLTRQFFIYANTAYQGRLDPTDLQWFIPRKKIDALSLLDSLVANKGENIERWEPVNPQYQALRKKLELYNQIEISGGWDSLPSNPKKKFKPGDQSDFIKQLKNRLIASHDLEATDTSNLYDSSLSVSVKNIQASFGLKQDAIVTNELINELNVPIRLRIEQMLINLERMRWLPENPAPDRIVVNIPAFELYVFEGGKPVMRMDIVVGKQGTGTVIFNDNLKYIVFSPYWNVPRSIVRNEIVPGMRRNKHYLSRHNMEITGYSGGLPIVRQRPGGSNSLGRVKFLFPNNYNIYLHDTPAKSLFSRDKRAFSHGCIRLADAKKMAEYLLRNDTSWTAQKISEAMSQTKEKWVTLKQPIPVFITYFTAWVDANDRLNFRDDIYKHDHLMAEHLFTHSELVADSTRK